MKDQLHIFSRRDPDLAYKGAWLWLPTSKVNAAVVKANLTVEVRNNQTGELVQLPLWREAPRHLVVPREYLEDKQEAIMRQRGILVDEETPKFEYIEYGDTITPGHIPDAPFDQVQVDMWTAVKKASRGVAARACGGGKTVIGCKLIAHMHTPTIIVAPAGHVLAGWYKTLIREEGGLNIPDERIGWIEGGRYEWKDKDVVLATVQSLANKSAEWSDEFRFKFGLAIYDECHVMSAPHFVKAAHLFHGRRLGLTATPEREDGLEQIYYYHVGRPFFSELRQPLPATIIFYKLETELDFDDPEVADSISDKFGDFHFGKFRNYLGAIPKRNKLILKMVKKYAAAGRKILVLTHSRDQALQLAEEVEDAVAITGVNTKATDREKILQAHQVVFATTNVADQSLDDRVLDMVFFLTPFRNSRSLKQGLGRILRPLGDKRPLAIFYDDYHLRPCQGKMSKLRRLIKDDPTEHKVIIEYDDSTKKGQVSSCKTKPTRMTALQKYAKRGTHVPSALSAKRAKMSCTEKETKTPTCSS